MYLANTDTIERPGLVPSLDFQRFHLKDRQLLETFAEKFSPQSCEYNFANLFAWQDVYDVSWTLYQDRVLIYDGLNNTAFMPLGTDFHPQDLVTLSLNLIRSGLHPDLSLATRPYIERYPDLEKYYRIEEKPEAAEYIYDVNRLVELSGAKLHKKKNLIAQFKKNNPDYEVHQMSEKYRSEAFEFVRVLLNRRAPHPKTLDQEFEAIHTSFQYFDALNLEGQVVTIKGRIVAFAVFSRISDTVFDIQFEKADPAFKGAAQLINHETAKYLKDRCRYINREQDLGIQGLRQAKLSYDPVEVMASYELKFNPPN